MLARKLEVFKKNKKIAVMAILEIMNESMGPEQGYHFKSVSTGEKVDLLVRDNKCFGVLEFKTADKIKQIA